MSDDEYLRLKPRSTDVTEGAQRAPARAMLRAVGMRDEDFRKPLIAVASSWNEVTPCNLHLDKLGLDSLSKIDLAVAAEDRFGIAIPDEDLERFVVVGDLLDYVRRTTA